MFKKSIYIFTSIITILFILVSFYAGFIRSELFRLRNENIKLTEKIINLDLDNGTMKIKQKDYNSIIKSKEDKIESLAEDLAVEILVVDYAKKEIKKLDSYIDFMQQLCEANNLVYPFLLIND